MNKVISSCHFLTANTIFSMLYIIITSKETQNISNINIGSLGAGMHILEHLKIKHAFEQCFGAISAQSLKHARKQIFKKKDNTMCLQRQRW